MSKIRALAAPLQLVYPPMSNQDAIFLLGDEDTVKRLRTSDFYLIAQRSEAKFEKFTVEVAQDGYPRIVGTLSIRNLREAFQLDVGELMANGPFARSDPSNIALDLGEKIITIYFESDAEEGEVLADFFTTEKLIYERGLQRPGIAGLARVRNFATYDLLYVGMAKGSDTFERLIDGSHGARQKILGAEFPCREGSRVTDEIFLFAFDIGHFQIRTLDEGDNFSTSTSAEIGIHDRAVTADAEKAFIKLLDPKYNLQKYINYPKGKDGLHGSGIKRYAYFLNENITFTTESLSLVSSTNPKWSGGAYLRVFDNKSDFIVVEGDEVNIVQNRP